MTSYKICTLSRFSNIYGSLNGYFPISNSTPGHIFVPDKPNSVPDTSNSVPDTSNSVLDTSNSVPDTFVLDEAQRHTDLQKPEYSENTKHSCPRQNSYPWYNLAYPWYHLAYPWYNPAYPWYNLSYPWYNPSYPWYSLSSLG